MIKNHGYKSIPTGKIRAPGDIQKLRRDPHTIDLAASMPSTGGRPVDPIIIEWNTGKLLAGRHRFAAALNCELAQVDVLMLEGTPEELEQACLVEQIKRRQCTDAEVARLLELEHPKPEQTFPDVDDENDEDEEPSPPDVKRGRPSTGKKEAVAKVAKVTGRTEAAVAQAAHRAKRAEKNDESDGPSSCIETLGLKVPNEVQADAYAEVSFIEDVVKTLVKLQGDCSRHTSVGYNPYPQLYEAIHGAAAIARSKMPKSVCPHCKLTVLRKGCLACRGRGWLRECEMQSIPAPLLVNGPEAGIYVDGKWTMLNEVK